MAADSVFDRLAPFVREFIYTQAWLGLRPVQIEAAQAILDTDQDVLIAAGTASGKTEAAFLPILSLIEQEPLGSVRVLYVGPLKALINDQFQRLEHLCEQGGIPVHRWHGDVAATHKSELIEQPGGILQITPESIESLLINKTDKLRRLFGGLRFIVVDEVHAFLESDRGVQLRSQMGRLSQYALTGRPRRIGLSATVGDFEMARRWLNPHTPQQVRLINPVGLTTPTRFSHMHFLLVDADVPPELIDDLYQLTRNRKSLIFCNSRNSVELVTSMLNRLCQRDGLADRYLPHHGSISKEVREDAEARMRDDERPASVVCTNTLELGIDIGQLDLVVQIDSTQSVMSFVQRLGRSGRRDTPRTLQIYTLESATRPSDPFYERLPFPLLKALAVSDLFLEGWIEPPLERGQPYNVLYHQLLSRLVETHGLPPRDLVGHILNSHVFPGVDPEDYAELLKHLAQIDHLQQMPDGDLIVGLAGEKIARSRDFYTVFQTPPEWEVSYGTRVLGRISPSPNLLAGDCLLLVGRVWEVKEVLPDQKLVLVNPAHDTRKTMFSPTPVPDMHPMIAQRVHALLGRNDLPRFLSPTGQSALTAARQLSRAIGMNAREIFETEQEWVFFPWTGTRAARTLRYMLKHGGIEAAFPNMLFPWVITFKREGRLSDLISRLSHLAEAQLTPEGIVNDVPVQLLREHKYDEFLPERLLRARAIEEWVDWDESHRVLSRLVNSSY